MIDKHIENYFARNLERIKEHANEVKAGEPGAIDFLYGVIIHDLKQRIIRGCERNTDEYLILLLEKIKPSKTKTKDEYLGIFWRLSNAKINYTGHAVLKKKHPPAKSFYQAVKNFHEDLQHLPDTYPLNTTERYLKNLSFEEAYKKLIKQKSRYK